MRLLIEGHDHHAIMLAQLRDEDPCSELNILEPEDARVAHVEQQNNGERLLVVREVRELLLDSVLENLEFVPPDIRYRFSTW
jgi:hypothetical protein